MISKSLVIADYMKRYPFVVVTEDDLMMRYNSHNGYFEYRKPDNKKRNGWYRMRGLECMLRHLGDDWQTIVHSQGLILVTSDMEDK